MTVAAAIFVVPPQVEAGTGERPEVEALVTVASIGATAHELGHAFGLMHDYRNTAERVWRYSEDLMLNSFCAAQWLEAHRAFSSAPSLEQAGFPKFKFKMLPPSLASPPNAIRLRFEITGPNEIHQVQLLTEEIEYRGSLVGYKYLNGNSSGTVEFVTTDLTLQNNSLWLWTIDVHGNIDGSQEFPIDITSIIPPPETISIPDRHLAGGCTARNWEYHNPLYVKLVCTRCFQ